MKVRIDRKSLADALSILSRVVPSKPSREILKAIKMQTGMGDGPVMLLEANDGENGIKLCYPCEVEQEGGVLLEFSRINSIIASLVEDVVAFSVAPGETTVISGGSKFKLGCGRIEEYPALPKHADESQCSVICSELADAFIRCEPWAEPRSGANWRGIMLESDEHGVCLSATEEHGCAWTKIKTLAKIGDIKHLFPGRAARLISGFVALQPGTCEIGLSKSTASIRTDRGNVICRLQDGSYPNWRKIIPPSILEADWLRESAMTSLGQAMVTTTDTNRRMKMRFSDNTLKLSTKEDIFQSEIVVPFAWDNPDHECIYGVEYMLKGIASMPAGANVHFYFPEPGRPLRLESGSIGFLLAACEE